jgi:hypothetical protein
MSQLKVRITMQGFDSRVSRSKFVFDNNLCDLIKLFFSHNAA